MSPAPQNTPDHPLGTELPFQTAEPLVSPAEAVSGGPTCVLCRTPVQKTYYHVQGEVVCELCAGRVQSGQEAPPALSLARAALYGGAAAFAGFALYALVAIVTGLEIGLIAIVVGVMVGKAVRHGSKGMGGRPQQILAVVLTYFAITTSYIPVLIYHAAKSPPPAVQSGKTADTKVADANRPSSLGGLVMLLLLLAAAAPFLSLTEGVSGLISLFIIFIGLQRAWRLTGRTELLVMGPYEVPGAQ
jgi:hypothetical protein